jgi:hypothetical protein
MTFNTIQEAATAWRSHRPMFEAAGIYVGDDVRGYATDEVKRNYLAMDAQPVLSTAPNTGIPAFLTTLIDPTPYRVLFAPTRAAEIFGETRKGTWIDQTAMFPVVEHTGEVSSYGDFNENGRAGANQNWPQRQSYLFQTVAEYGELEIERAGLGRINWVGEVDGAATNVLSRFMNTTYFYGVQGLQNYGLLNDPNLSPALTPSTKAYGGVKWINNGQIVAQPTEIFADIQALWLQVVSQTNGIDQRQDQIDAEAEMTLGVPPDALVAMTATNTFGVNVKGLLKENFPNLRVVSAVQYGGQSSTNPVGNPAGNLIQLIVGDIAGQKTGYCAFNEKLRAHPIIRAMSSWKKKMTGGSWGAVVRMPMGISQMVGI